MTITEMNNRLANGANVEFCPWEMAWSNQCVVTLKQVHPHRMVTYTWQGGDGLIEKTSDVSYSVWNFIVASLS